MFTLKLTPDETRDLANALEMRLHAMLDELVHTDDRAYRADLRVQYESLERVQRQLATCIKLAAA